MRRVFVDSWAWAALVDTNAADHNMARLANEELLVGGYVFVTTNFVVDEALTLIRYNVGHTAAVRFWHMLQKMVASKLVHVEHIDSEREFATWDIFEQYNDQTFSFTDCTSFAVIRALQLSHAFTADRHCAVLGFTLIP